MLALTGCGSDSKDEETPKPWDGSHTALEEYGDWVDTGPYASCSVNWGAADPCAASVEAFDLSGCNRSTLGGLDREGIYRLKIRYPLLGDTLNVLGYYGIGSSIRFGEEGAPVSLLGYAVSDWQMDSQTLLIQGKRPWSSAPSLFNTYTAVGCEAPTPWVLTGCYAYCSNGHLLYESTFRAERMTWGREERESSGGLRPVSESPVDLGVPVDVYVAKDHAYVVSINGSEVPGGLTVFDVSDRAHPVFKTSISMPGDSYWNGVWSKGDALYIASGASGVIVFDISNPGAPTYVRNVPGGSAIDVHTVLVDGDRLYAMSPSPNAETLIFDVSTPLEPRLLGRHVLGVPGYPHDAFAHGNRLYISHGTGGYQVVDVSDPANVKLLGGYAFDGMFAHHNAVGTFAGQTIAFEGGERLGAHVRVLQVDDPAHIVKIGEFKLRDVTSVHNLILKDQRLYVAWYQEGVRVLDVSNPTQPRQVAHFNTFRDTDPRSGSGMYEGVLGIRVPGDGYVYVVDDVRGLFIFPEL
ncbi:LVIVD repeat-containing protein [Pyxidicoccus parkwayensis]|uniref:LVIVD repeat-containing protein n=1 Tax=Pyxidicoccus parkwayensis TaxID=2813578 RepID=UPI001F5130CB|nr:hypothetical protein [Pyxidicoccus parkwaysis]